jgi:hypothetical protein
VLLWQWIVFLGEEVSFSVYLMTQGRVSPCVYYRSVWGVSLHV